MNVAHFLAQIHQAVLLQCSEEDQPESVNQFEVVRTRIPGIEQDGARLEALVLYRIVDRIEIARGSGTLHQVHHTDPAYQAVCHAAVLAFDQFDEPGIAFILYAVVGDQSLD